MVFFLFLSLSAHLEPKIRDLKDKETKVRDAKTRFQQECPHLKGPLFLFSMELNTVTIHFRYIIFLAMKMIVNVNQPKKVI